MAWSLDYRSPMESALLDDFFTISGKALYLATAFEDKCKYLLFYFKLADHYKETGDVHASLDLANGLRGLLLGQTIKKIHTLDGIDDEDIKKIERAKEARNFIVHESTLIGTLILSKDTIKAIEEKNDRLRDELEYLTIGDNLVSQWLYEIQEKEPAPRELCLLYSNLVHRWVFKELSNDKDL